MMRNNALNLIFVFFVSFYLKGQTTNMQNISTDAPKIIPPSPTAISLMKFEEIPVSNYTGVPDISIPLMIIPTNSKDISMNISLKYHPSSIAVDEVSSDVGLGWNLIYGGSVTRTVRGHADELRYVQPSKENKKKIGIYHTDLNTYYQFSDNVLDTYKTYYNQNLSSPLYNLGNKFIWTASRTDIFDTEHDIWQFNFMGNSGRFYIRKNQTRNTLEVVPLDNYIVKIINHYNPTSYIPEGFTIYDDKGFKYVFNIVETSFNKVVNRSSTYKNDENGIPQLTSNDNFNYNEPFTSAFHLSQIFDNNNQEIVNFQYQDKPSTSSLYPYIESHSTSNITRHVYNNGSMIDYYRDYNFCDDLPPVEVINNSTTTIEVKKIKTINVINHGKIEFEFLQGRDDSNIQQKNKAPFLKFITIKNWSGKQIKKFIFIQNYLKSLHERMFLKKIEELDSENNLIGYYNLDYKEFINNGEYVPGKDRWGFLNLQGCDATEDKRITIPELCDTGVLQKIQYPTKGCTILEYESNQFSFIGNQPIPNSSENINYGHKNSQTLYFTPTNNYYNFPPSTINRKVIFHPNIIDSQSVNIALILSKKDSNGHWIPMGNISCPLNDSSCCMSRILERGVEYKLLWNNFNIPNHNSTGFINFDVFDDVSNSKFLYGGGIRIKKINYFDQNISLSDYSSNPNLSPSKQKEYSYQLIDSTDYSSGSLVGPIPQFEYEYPFSSKIIFAPNGSSNCNVTANETPNYATLTSSDSNFTILQTHGGYVGYKNVTVKEKEKGKILYTYSNPTNYFADFSNFGGPPFVKPKDYDFKRGLLTHEIALNNNGEQLYEIKNFYNFEEKEEYLGIKFSKPHNIYNGSSPNYASDYTQYLNRLTEPCMSCDSDHVIPKSFWGGLPLDINTPNYMPFPIFETYGWAKLISKEVKNYFYENGNQKVSTTTENFTYNSLNKKLSEHKINQNDGNSFTTKFYYDIGNNSAYSQNRISEIEKIESYKDGKLLDTKKINYNNNWNDNVSFLPNQILSSFGSGTFETEITYDQYDSKGNLLQYTTKAGIPVTIIWGYHKTQPIAKVEGIQLSEIEQSNIDSIVNASNLDASNPSTEPALITALDAFRKLSGLKSSQITTFTYDPLIGVTSITPPSGIREVYLYDNANRLKEIRENNASGKLLKEFKYNYKQ